jgi:hypothetical protein
MPADKNKKTFDDVPSELIRRFPRGPVDWGAVIAELEAKRDALDKAIASFRLIKASGVLFGAAEDAMPAMADSVSLGLHGGEVPVGAFLGKSIPEAAKLCLQITKRKLTTREVVDSLLKGGIETTAKTSSFPSIVHSILARSVKTGSGIIKVDRSHWGLAEWYPRGLASANRTNGKKRHKAVRKSKAAKQTPSEVSKQSEPGTVPERIWSVLSKPGTELTTQEVGEKVGIKSNVAALLLGKLIAQKCAEKMPNGRYRALKTAV